MHTVVVTEGRSSSFSCELVGVELGGSLRIRKRKEVIEMGRNHLGYVGLMVFVMTLLYELIIMPAMGEVTPPPLPLLPFPSHQQLVFQRREQAMFFHFGVNTFSGREQGDGTEDPSIFNPEGLMLENVNTFLGREQGDGTIDPSIFNPEGLNATQWVQTAKNAGFKIVILTAKHADGFCLWPTAYSNYSVKSSPWKNGTGDVVREVAEAAKNEGLEFGIYMSPLDRHEPTFGNTTLYNEHYLGQLRELLSMYGPISEVWLDGNKGPAGQDMNYLFDSWFAVIHQMQPTANIFSDAGPDVRWVGDEAGQAGTTNWNMLNKSLVTIGGGFEQYLNVGDEYGVDWVPPECDVSIRPGWFWHENQQPRNIQSLLDIYYTSSGRNCVLLLNAPPNRTGLLHETDVAVLKEFRAVLDSIFSQNLAGHAHVTASSTRGKSTPFFQPSQILSKNLDVYWAPEEGVTTGYLTLDLGSTLSFNVVKIQEAVHMGQRVRKYHIDVEEQRGTWKTVATGTTIGYKKLDQITKVQSQFVRIVIDEARAEPLIAAVGLYLDNVSNIGGNCNSNNTLCLI